VFPEHKPTVGCHGAFHGLRHCGNIHPEGHR
jgi:hypothetical protein